MKIILKLTLFFISVGLSVPPAMSQAVPSTTIATDETITGAVSSATPSTLVVKTADGQYHVFIFDPYIVKPASIPLGATVKVVSRQSGEPGVRIAHHVNVTAQPSAPQTPESAEPVPLAVRQLEKSMERSVRKFKMGFRGGVGLDPEVISVGVHASFGPFFHRDVSFRPNAEFAWGEVTKMIALNLEPIYRLPFTPRQGRWSAYVGGGPSFVFASKNYERAEAGDNGIDFSDFEYSTGLNILTGIQFRSGMFFELKSTVYASPHLRLIMGFTF